MRNILASIQRKRWGEALSLYPSWLLGGFLYSEQHDTMQGAFWAPCCNSYLLTRLGACKYWWPCEVPRNAAKTMALCSVFGI